MAHKFNNTGVNAGVLKFEKVLRMPAERATSEMKKMYGNTIRVICTVKLNLSGSARNPEAVA